MLGIVEKYERPLLWLLALVIVWLVWRLIAMLIAKPLLMPTPAAFVEAAWNMFVAGPTIYGAFWVSMREAGIGFAIALIGVPLGLMIGSSKRLYAMFEPINSAAYSLPHIALVPIAIVWFGLGIWSKLFMVFISTFFVIVISTTEGVSTVGRELQDVALVFGVSRLRRFFTLTVPGTMPFIMAGVRLGVGRALVGVVAAELFASTSGLGHLLSIYGNNFQTAELFVDIATFAVVGGIASVLIGIVARWFDRWRV
jgi:NitT/TauT family transport system permease protein